MEVLIRIHLDGSHWRPNSLLYMDLNKYFRRHYKPVQNWQDKYKEILDHIHLHGSH
jgi:hypothetical protein